jgi:hypothetical protein
MPNSQHRVLVPWEHLSCSVRSSFPEQGVTCHIFLHSAEVCPSRRYQSLVAQPGDLSRPYFLGVGWYVQNISTFPNTFAVVSPLICVFWMQLTRTNVVFSRIALVSCFLCRNPTFRKNPRKYRKNPILPEDPRSQKMRRRGAGRPPHN